MAVPVSLEDAKCQLRHYDEDLTPERRREIEGFIADAAAWVEKYTGHILAARNVTEQFFGTSVAHLRAWPIAAIAEVGVAYTSAEGAPIAVPGVRLDVIRRPARLVPPRLPGGEQPYTVTVRAGYEPGDTVPGDMRRAMLVLISAFDADREGGDLFAKAEATARLLCRDYRLRRL